MFVLFLNGDKISMCLVQNRTLLVNLNRLLRFKKNIRIYTVVHIRHQIPNVYLYLTQYLSIVLAFPFTYNIYIFIYIYASFLYLMAFPSASIDVIDASMENSSISALFKYNILQ